MRSSASPAKGRKSTTLRVGMPAPPFTLPAHDGTILALETLRGRRVVLYFYPKDHTPGCTREACEFRDRLAAITRRGAVVVGISPEGAIEQIYASVRPDGHAEEVLAFLRQS